MHTVVHIEIHLCLYACPNTSDTSATVLLFAACLARFGSKPSILILMTTNSVIARVNSEVITMDDIRDAARRRSASLKLTRNVCLSTSPLPHRCKALQHSGQLSWGDQAVRLWRERPAHRFHGQLLCWNALLHVGESALHACAPTPFPLALSPLSFSSFLTLLLFAGSTLCLPFLWPSLTSLPRSEGCAQERTLWQRARQLCSLFLLVLSP